MTLRRHPTAVPETPRPGRCHLFLDIDGVMIPFGDQAIASECAANLRQIMSAVPDLCIVISSSWRTPPVGRLMEIWREARLPWPWIVGSTPDLAGRPGSDPEKLRGLEIRRWLEDHAAASTGFAILDDQTDEIEPCFPSSVIFGTNPTLGLTNGIADEIIRLLLNSPPAMPQ